MKILRDKTFTLIKIMKESINLLKKTVLILKFMENK